MDFNEDWDKVSAEVERYMESKNVSRKQWTAIQAKVLEQRYADDPAKFDEVIKQRKDAGLFYLDDMFPNDPMDWCLDEIRLDKHVFPKIWKLNVITGFKTN